MKDVILHLDFDFEYEIGPEWAERHIIDHQHKEENNDPPKLNDIALLKLSQYVKITFVSSDMSSLHYSVLL